MALKGTLSDLGIIDLIQFPHAGRKTGELVISGTDRDARLFYRNGSLVHAVTGDAGGMDALVRIVDWEEGDFEFIPDSEPESRTIDLDLHRAVMKALKLHDQLKLDEEQRGERPSGSPFKPAAVDQSDAETAIDEGLSARLAEFIASSGFALYACVTDSEGKLVAKAESPDGPPPGVNELYPIMQGFLSAYPREGLSRAIIEDAAGIVVIARLEGSRGLMVIAGKGTLLGAVSMSVGRFALTL